MEVIPNNLGNNITIRPRFTEITGISFVLSGNT